MATLVTSFFAKGFIFSQENKLLTNGNYLRKQCSQTSLSNGLLVQISCIKILSQISFKIRHLEYISGKLNNFFADYCRNKIAMKSLCYVDFQRWWSQRSLQAMDVGPILDQRTFNSFFLMISLSCFMVDVYLISICNNRMQEIDCKKLEHFLLHNKKSFLHITSPM